MDRTLTDAFGAITLPDSPGVTGVYNEVCVRDTYRFSELRDSGLAVSLAVDLGASWGVASRMMRHYWPAARIVAYEPDQVRFPYLARNCRTVECNRRGVVGYAGHRVWSLLGIGADFGERRADPEIALRSIQDPLSAWAAFGDLPPIDLLKIDVEGFELGILHELSELGMLPEVITGEWHFANARVMIRHILSPTHDVEITQTGPEVNWQPFFARRRKDAADTALPVDS